MGNEEQVVDDQEVQDEVESAEVAEEKFTEAAIDAVKAKLDKFDEDPADENDDTEETATADDADTGGDDKAGSGEQEEVISAELIGRAKDAGLTEDEINSFESEKEVMAAVRVIESRSTAAKADNEEVRAARESKDDSDDEDPFQALKTLKLDEDEYDEDVIKVVDLQRKCIETLQSKIDQLVQGQQQNVLQQTQAQFFESFDRYIDGLDEEFEEFVGKGSGKELSDDNAMQTRVEIIEQAHALLKFYGEQNKQVPLETVFKRATNAILGDKIVERKGIKRQEKAGRRRAQNIGRVSSRRGARGVPTDPVEAATAAVARKLAEFDER